FENNTGIEYDLLLTKHNEYGDLLWSKLWGDSIGEEAGYSIVNTPDNNVVVVGSTSSYGNGNKDVLLAKFDTNGEFVWAKAFGGSANEEGAALIYTSDNDFVVT